MPKPKANSPLLGYNTNVRHSGELFHIQTEDSGVAHPHIITHLFAEGTILATKKTPYADHLQKENLEDLVRQMMREQHKTMFVELRDGAHDANTKKILGYWDDGSTPPPVDKLPSAPPSKPAPAPSEPPPEPPPSKDDSVRVVLPVEMQSPAQEANPKESAPPSPSLSGRSIFDTPDEDGEFGDGLITDKSLDEVILSYLTDDPDE